MEDGRRLTIQKVKKRRKSSKLKRQHEMEMTETDTRLGAIPGRSMARDGRRKTRITKEMCQEQTRNVDTVAWTQF